MLTFKVAIQTMTNVNVHRLTSLGIFIFFKKYRDTKQRKGMILSSPQMMIVTNNGIKGLSGMFLFVPKKIGVFPNHYEFFFVWGDQ